MPVFAFKQLRLLDTSPAKKLAERLRPEVFDGWNCEKLKRSVQMNPLNKVEATYADYLFLRDFQEMFAKTEVKSREVVRMFTKPTEQHHYSEPILHLYMVLHAGPIGYLVSSRYPVNNRDKVRDGVANLWIEKHDVFLHDPNSLNSVQSLNPAPEQLVMVRFEIAYSSRTQAKRAFFNLLAKNKT